MNKNFTKNAILSLVFLTGVLLFASCRAPQNAVYFSNLDSAKIKQLQLAEFKEPLIQPDDILSINIQTLGRDAFATATGGADGTPGPSTTAGATSGFLVSKNGTVEMPMLGNIKLAGLTTSEAIALIRTEAAKYYKEPTVQVRFTNFKVTVLGEVAKPAAYTVAYERVTVIDALSLAGDLTIYGRRNNVLLMRDNGEKKDVVRLNLNSSDVVTSPYFYLKQNDVIYVEPIKSKADVNSTSRLQLITIGISLVGLIVTLINQL